MKNKFGHISSILTAFRAAIAPYLVWDARDGRISHWFLFIFVCGFLSDVLDGEILRRLKISDVKLRFLDSVTDAIFYMSVFVCMWLIRPEIIQNYSLPITILFLTQACSWIFSLIKHRKTAGYHSYIAKIWGLSLLIGVVGFFRSYHYFFLFAVIFGIVSNMEDMVITAIMPYWKCDILGIRSAQNLRLEYQKLYI